MSEAAIVGWERALMAAEKVKERLRCDVKALDDAKVPYAVVGGNAVAEWVARALMRERSATPETSICSFAVPTSPAYAPLETAGFVYHHLMDVDVFLDGPQGKPSAGVHLLYAGEKVRAEDDAPCPDLDESERAAEFQVTTLAALVRMKLLHWKLIDRVHLRDLMGVGLIDATWPARFPAPLAVRLQELLDDPNG